jgi:ATP-dependent Lon protease
MKPLPTVIQDIPVVPLRDMVVYPHGVHPLFVGTERSIRGLEAAMAADKQVLLVAKRDPDVEEPSRSDLFEIGTICTVLQLLKLPDGTVKVLIEGGARARIAAFDSAGAFMVADAVALADTRTHRNRKAMLRTVLDQFENYASASKKIPSEIVASLTGIDDPGRLIDTIAVQMTLRIEDRQRILETVDVAQRMEQLLGLLEAALEVHQMEKRIRGRVKKQMEKSQREYYLNEQIKAIQKELGELEDAPQERDVLKARIEAAGMPTEVREKATSELNKLMTMSPMSAEATVVRSYLDWITGIPWKKRSRVRRDIAAAQRILEADHYGLEEVKDRIIEFLAVQTRVQRLKGPVLCLVGPPGVGKTSLGESIARATNRRFVRMALGGMRDEAEIRGHRRTYIGSLPGKVLQKMAKARVRNPLFLLDEVDKMGTDMRGDPASALLEVLDPEQNHSFSDHYLEVDYDLSDVFFVCTSNSINIPAPLLDRMEVIRLPGYTEQEKLNIALRYLLPKQKRQNGIGEAELVVTDETIVGLIRHYTREAGVRGLERELAKTCRKFVKEQALARSSATKVISPELIEHYNGVRKFTYGRAEEHNEIGNVTGLAWTQFGGELLNIEAVAVPGKGRQTRTGSLGDVMQESIQAAMTFVRSRSQALGIPPNFHEENDIHVHVPEGATPKDGPSAGIGMCTAMISVLTGIPVRADVAMTGEITLRGQVLPVGGLKEKLLAAHRGSIRTVIIPEENQRDLKEIPDKIKQDLDIRPVKWMDQVLELALEHAPRPAVDPSAATSAEAPATRKRQRGDGAPVNPH